MKNTLVKDALILTVITLVAGLLLGLVYEITKAPIAAAEENARQAAYAAVFAEADSFEDYADFDADEAVSVLTDAGYEADATIENVLVAKDSNGEVIGYVISVTDNNGYGGKLTFSMGITNDGTINGISFTTLNETAGLGMRAKEEPFSSQFAGKSAQSLEVVKTAPGADNEIQAISGATITSKAVTGGVNAGLAYFYAVLGGAQ